MGEATRFQPRMKDSVDRVAVVELHALTELEGVDATVLGDRRSLGSAAGNGGSGIPIPLHQAVEHAEDDRGALVLLGVIRIDERGLGEVEVHDLLAGSVAATAVLAATAASESSHSAGSKGATDEGTTTHHGLGKLEISHAILLIMQVHGARRRLSTPLVRPGVRTRCLAPLRFAMPLGCSASRDGQYHSALLHNGVQVFCPIPGIFFSLLEYMQVGRHFSA